MSFIEIYASYSKGNKVKKISDLQGPGRNPGAFFYPKSGKIPFSNFPLFLKVYTLHKGGKQ